MIFPLVEQGFQQLEYVTRESRAFCTCSRSTSRACLNFPMPRIPGSEPPPRNSSDTTPTNQPEITDSPGRREYTGRRTPSIPLIPYRLRVSLFPAGPIPAWWNRPIHWIITQPDNSVTRNGMPGPALKIFWLSIVVCGPDGEVCTRYRDNLVRNVKTWLAEKLQYRKSVSSTRLIFGSKCLFQTTIVPAIRGRLNT